MAVIKLPFLSLLIQRSKRCLARAGHLPLSLTIRPSPFIRITFSWREYDRPFGRKPPKPFQGSPRFSPPPRGETPKRRLFSLFWQFFLKSSSVSSLAFFSAGAPLCGGMAREEFFSTEPPPLFFLVRRPSKEIFPLDPRGFPPVVLFLDTFSQRRLRPAPGDDSTNHRRPLPVV